MPIAIVFIMFFLAPVMIIALIIYFVIKSRKQKIQLAELALKNGQPIPQEVAQSKPQPNDQALWEKGVKRMFLGIGIVIFAIFIHSRMLRFRRRSCARSSIQIRHRWITLTRCLMKLQLIINKSKLWI